MCVEKGLAHIFVLWLMPNFLNSFLLLVRVAQTLRCGYQSTQFEWWSQDVPVAGWDGETGKGWKAVLGAFLRRWPQWDVQRALSYSFCKVRKLGHLFTNSPQSLVEAYSWGLWQFWRALGRADWTLLVRGSPQVKSHKWYVRKWWVSNGEWD